MARLLGQIQGDGGRPDSSFATDDVNDFPAFLDAFTGGSLVFPFLDFQKGLAQLPFLKGKNEYFLGSGPSGIE